MNYLTEHHIFVFLLQVALLLGLSRIAGELFRHWKQPAVTAEILVGIILGPTIFGRALPELYGQLFSTAAIQHTMLETVAWIGILFFLLKTGLEMDFSSAWRQRGDALTIAVMDIVIPMALAFSLCYFLPASFRGTGVHPTIFALFLATVLTISALPIAARALQDFNLYKTDVGFLIMCALSLNDIIGWVVFTLVIGLATHTEPHVARIAFQIALTIGFTVLALTKGRHLTNYVIGTIQRLKLPEPSSSLTFVVLLGMLCGAITLKIGIHALLGFFIAGIMAGEAQALSERTRNVIAQMVNAIFVPLFFASIGLSLDFAGNFHWKLVLLVTVLGIVGRFAGALAGVAMTKQARANWRLIAIAHTPGGEMQIVIGMLALSYGLIAAPVFVAIVIGALVSAVIIGPWMGYALKRRTQISAAEFFERRAVTELRSESRDGAIMELCRLAAYGERMPNDKDLFDAVMNRERALGTALTDGVAIPHARLERVMKPLVVFGRSKTGIDWNSPDGKPTTCVFLIITPLDDHGVQLQILRTIAELMSDPETRKHLADAENAVLWNVLHDSLASHYVEKN